MVLALFALDLQPALGEVVQVDAIVAESESGSATLRWRGVDRAEGARAWFQATTAGPAEVCVADRCLTLQVGAAAPACANGAPADDGRCTESPVRGQPVRGVDAAACFDDAWPRVVDGVLLFCDKGGKVDSAVDLETGERWALPASARSPVSVGDALWLGGDAPLEYAPRSRRSVSTAWPTTLQALVRPDTSSWLLALLQWHALPLPDAAPVGAAGAVIWTERKLDDDVIIGLPEGRAALGGGLGNQRRPVAHGSRVAWFDERGARGGGPAVVVADLGSGERRAWAADSGFLGPLALDAERACWEDRSRLRGGEGGIEIRCSDGRVASGAADLLSPSLGGGWLAWHQGKQVHVARLTAPSP